MPEQPDNPHLDTTKQWPPPSVSDENREATKGMLGKQSWPPPSVSGTEQHKAETASRIAKWLLIILATGIALNYLCVMLLVWFKREDGLKALEDAFHAWLPVVTSLLGGAVAFYYKEGK